MIRDKPGVLVVDYLGLADQLEHALANYTESDGKKTLFALPALQEHLLELEDGKTRWNQVITELSRALMNDPAFTLRAARRQSVSLSSACPLRRQR